MRTKIKAASWPSHTPARRWQQEALPLALGAIERGQHGLVRACTGAGKAALIAQVARSLAQTPGRGMVIVSTPTERLVRQLQATLGRWVGAGHVGAWWGGEKRLERVTVVCNPSLAGLVQQIRNDGLTVWVWIADEAHSSESAEVKRVAESETLRDAVRLGFTATPYRARTEEALSLFDAELYDYDLPAALADGVVVPWHVIQWDGGDVPLDDACEAMCKAAVERGLGAGLVDAASIDDAEAFAVRLREAGVRAAAVHSGLSDDVVDALAKQLQDGLLDVLVHVALLKEGVDWPWLRWVCLRRKVASPVWLVQHVGRVLRVYPGKRKAVIFDPHDLLGAMPLVGRESAVGLPASQRGVGASREGKEGRGEEGEREGHKARGLDDLARRLREVAYRLEREGKLRRATIKASEREGNITPDTLAKMARLSGRLPKVRASQADLDVLREVWSQRLAVGEGVGLDWIAVAGALVG